MSNTTITVIPLATSHVHAPYISEQLLQLIRENKKQEKKTLIFFSRRGNSRAWICQDCGYFERCPNCDIALAYHTSPYNRLVCHQCNYVAHHKLVCQNCSGSHFVSVGVGIQRIQQDLSRLLSDTFVVERIDSDTYKKLSELDTCIHRADVIIATSLAHFTRDSGIGTIVFLCFEMNLSVPEYDFEERLFDEVAYFKKEGLPIYIQTYTQDHPLLEIIRSGNYQDFLFYALKERGQFLYPPFSDFLTLRIHDPKKDRVTDMTTRLMNKIQHLKKDTTLLAANVDVYEKYAGEWVQKITLRDTNLKYLISELEVEIVRNRSVSLERG